MQNRCARNECNAFQKKKKSHNSVVSSNHSKTNHYKKVWPEKAKETKHHTWNTSRVLKYDVLYIYSTNIFQNGGSIFYFF